jgi:hypothetical protein
MFEQFPVQTEEPHEDAVVVSTETWREEAKDQPRRLEWAH